MGRSRRAAPRAKPTAPGLRFLWKSPGVELHVDVEASELHLPDGRVVEYPIDAFARYCLTQGIDQLGYLQQQSDAIRRFEEARPWKP